MAELVGLPVKGTLECDELVLTWFKGLDGVAVALAGVRVWQITSGDRRATWEATAACPRANVDLYEAAGRVKPSCRS
jgi:hypothetical protein